ncbi:hypothetical protein [uncultured Tateyamaria sp.]|uniref:hypothetical protein n=1 Tax=uncultured Tateyamaria sp. TaxID=455651 RepID=UPI0026287806|nr:hypothetical protein [uncultured Tateyamaria sp.]
MLSKYEGRELTRKRIGAIAVAVIAVQAIFLLYGIFLSENKASLIDPVTTWEEGLAIAFAIAWALGVFPLSYFVFGWIGVGMRITFESMILTAKFESQPLEYRGMARYPVVFDWLFPGLK